MSVHRAEHPIVRIVFACALLLVGFAPSLRAQETTDDGCCETPDPAAVEKALEETSLPAAGIPDVVLLDQSGAERKFSSELVGDRTVVLGFFFTRCTTICPPLTATTAQLQDLWNAERPEGIARDEVHFISLSLDPTHDTPTRLATWAKTFGADPGWSFVTGDKAAIDTVLEHFGVAVGRPEEHAPILLIGDRVTGTWRREYALAPAKDLHRVLSDRVVARHAAVVEAAPRVADARPENPSAHGYFGDLPIVDQRGDTQRLYTDLIRGRTVVVSCFFSTCTGICPPMHRNLLEIGATFEEEVGKELFFLLVTVDPETDTVPTLSTFAEGLGVDAGWHLLTGSKDQVEAVLGKFGLTTPAKENHKGVFLIGNDRTGLWEKAFGLGQADELIPIVERVLRDRGEGESSAATP